MIDLQKEIQRQKKIIQAATGGPWKSKSLTRYPDCITLESGLEVARANTLLDERFIAESRTAWPRALEALELALYYVEGDATWEALCEKIEKILKGESNE